MNSSYLQEEAKSSYDKFVNKGKILGVSLSRSEELKKFSNKQKELLAYNNSILGLQNVPLSKIIGSVQKNEDFKKGFIPKNSIVKIRWCNIYIEMLGDFKLPPITLYKIREEYYVYDGNHRVSVANFLNFSSIEADVIEFFSGKDTEEEIKYRKKFEFRKLTQLEIDLTESHDYKKLIKDIKSIDIDKTILENSNFWYQQIYTPIIKVLKFNDLISPTQLEGDLYIKILEHRNYLINNANKYDYSYALIDFINMKYLQIKCTLKTQIQINHYIDILIRRLYKEDKERYMNSKEKKQLHNLRELIRGNFIDELYFSRTIKKDVRVWYYKKFLPTLEFFEQKSHRFRSENFFEKNQLKLYRELKDYTNYYKIKSYKATMKEGVLDYILEIFLPILDYLSTKKIDEKLFVTEYFKLSHRKLKFLKNGKNINLEELESLYLDIGSESSTIQEWLSKRLKKEKTFKGDIFKGLRELLIIKGQDQDSFNDLMELYEGTTNYKTILILKEQIWNFVNLYPTQNWVQTSFSINLDKLIQNKEAIKFFKTERFMHFIIEKSNTYTLIDFYTDIIKYGENQCLSSDIDILLMKYMNKQ